MQIVTLEEISRQQGGFYVPQFEVRVRGVGLPRDVLRDVTQLTYKDNIKEIDSFELTVNNWDPTTRKFKYVGSEDEKSLAENPLHRVFDPCNHEVEIWMGYLGGLRLMLKGNFTTLEPNFPSGGAPTLAVRGLNVLHQLRGKQYTTVWTKVRDSEIATKIQTLIDPGPPQRKRFPRPIETLPEKQWRQREPELPYVAQDSQYDIDFLFQRARERGYVIIVLEADPLRRRPRRPERLYFGPSEEGQTSGLRDVMLELKWGVSLIDFKPTLTTANQIRSVTVKGWNRATRQRIQETVNLDDRRLNLNRDLHEVLKKCDPREEVVVDEPVFTAAQAREKAAAILKDRHKEMVKATATCVGVPDLRAGQWVKIAGFGSRFSGTYFITDTTHTIGDGGYTTRFGARREEQAAKVRG
jgi:phage protein D